MKLIGLFRLRSKANAWAVSAIPPFYALQRRERKYVSLRMASAQMLRDTRFTMIASTHCS